MLSLTPPVVALVAHQNAVNYEHRGERLVTLVNLNEIEVDAIRWAFEEDADIYDKIAQDPLESPDQESAELCRKWTDAERWAIEEATERRSLTWSVEHLRRLFPQLMMMTKAPPWTVVAGMALVLARLDEVEHEVGRS